MGFYDKVANVQNVRPGAVAIITLPCSVTYDKIKLKLGGGLVAADLTRIEFKANGKTFYVDNAPFANLRQAYKAIGINAAWVTVDFTEPKSRGGAVSQFLASIPANLLKTLTCEVTIGAAANVLSTMECHVEFRQPTGNPFIKKMLDFNASLPNAGEHDLFLPAGASGGIIKRLWMHTGGALVTGIDLRVNRVSAKRQLKADWQFEQTQNDLVPQALLDVIDFMADGNVQGALNTGPDASGKAPVVELRVTVSAAEVIHGYLEFIDPINRL